ncbi:MAG: GNAT family N-acetyltransferase [Hyphomicrobiales bacterium]
MRASDRAAWVEMRNALWPNEPLEALADGIDRVLAGDGVWGFMAETIEGTPAGFAEIAIREYANGCESQPVPFLEGIYVEAKFRRQGIGAGLIARIEAFLAQRGFRELGSDTQIDNRSSQAAHLGWGFSETERVVYFRKSFLASSR